MTPTIFQHYFRCDCSKQLMVLTCSSVVCPDCGAMHSVDARHTRTTKPRQRVAPKKRRKTKWVAWDMGAVEVEEPEYGWWV